MKVEEETQPRLLGSTPTPPHPTREALAPGEVLGAATSSLHQPLPNCSPSPWQTQPEDQGDPSPQSTPQPCQQGRGTQGSGRQLESRWSSCNAEAPPCPGMTFQDCETETCSTKAARLGHSPLQEATPSSSASGFTLTCGSTSTWSWGTPLGQPQPLTWPTWHPLSSPHGEQQEEAGASLGTWHTGTAFPHPVGSGMSRKHQRNQVTRTRHLHVALSELL